MKRKFFSGSSETLGDRQIRVVASTGSIDRTGEQVVPAGIDLSGFLANPIILWQHDPEHPIGRAANVAISGNSLVCDIEFAPAGVSKKADEICGLAKSGVLSGVSIGFDPVEMEPMQPANPRGAQRYCAIDLMEISIVSIPANTDAAIIQRSARVAVRREGRKLSADTRTKLETGLAHINSAMDAHRATEAALNKSHETLTALLQSVENNEEDGENSKRGHLSVVKQTGQFLNYPSHLRGFSPYHFAGRAQYDEDKLRGKIRV